MFNEANVDNRLRELVRGRVIVATTSKIVEFLDEKLKHSYPLYSVDDIPSGFMLVFSVEVNGYLTFDQNSEVRILPETQVFEKLQYDPTAFRLVRAADAFVPLIQNAYVGRYDNPGGNPSQMYVTVRYSITGVEDVLLNIEETFDFNIAPPSLFPVNTPWRGLKHLPKGIVDVGFASPNIP